VPGPPSSPEAVALVAPDPPLADPTVGIALQPWTSTLGDIGALAAAWSDPALGAACRVPAEPTAAAAGRWIAGEPRRRAAGACLDLVIRPLATEVGVLGEVGLRNVDRMRRRAEIGWWVAAEHRGRGVATAATRLLVDWALSEDGGFAQVWARIEPENVASARVAASAGLVELGPVAGTVVWSRARPARVA
jgi:RimJ/RimL family protein N-acetyltransferase